MEAYGDQSLLCWRKLYAQASQIREIHSSDGLTLYQSARDTPRAEGHLLPANNRRQKESKFAIIYIAWGDNQGNSSRSILIFLYRFFF